jgi:hypothetical protein
MRSERSQILAMLLSRRIDLAEAERLLAVVCSRDRFLFLALGTVFVLTVGAVNPAQYHMGESLSSALHSTFQSVTGSETFHQLRIFMYRLLGELP